MEGNMTLFWIAQILGMIGTIINICAIQINKKKSILVLFMSANIVFGINFILLGSYSGGIICFIAAIQTVITYLFEKREKVFPKVLIPIYIIVAIICGLVSYQKWIDILPLLCSILYTMTIIQKKEEKVRKITFINVAFWVIYDLIIGAYTAAISDVFFTISSVIAIIRYDRKKIEEERRNEISR